MDGNEVEGSNAGATGAHEDVPDDPNVEDLLAQLELLERTVDDPDEREQVRKTMRVARRVPGSELFGKQIDKYTSRDVAESFVGSILISLPMLVEDGVFDIGGHFARSPAFLVGNAAFVLIMAIGLLYWTDIQDVQVTRPIFGIVPRRLVGVLVSSFVTAAFLMSLWGRVDWSEPWLALCYVSVVWTAAAFGAALGDILPGESKGADLSEDVIG